MTFSIKDWFLALSRREQILVGFLAVLLVITGLFYGVIRPVYAGIESAEQRYELAIERQLRIETKVAVLKAPLDIKPVTGNQPLDAFLSQSAGEEGFPVDTINAQTDGRIMMTIGSAKPTALFGWLARLETQGIVVSELNVMAAPNNVVSANLVLFRPAG
ncbi:type II secretion system protein GspM [Parasphingorhabdus halotolerans]|uniref:Type II secretion system protein M n=1 Tax=Parasphingorhabdus halotolerans TaxID=2725558 RepID=A0A6H2DPW8_9SPHN|nr:type II secretion system protein GspM [Parasphingorhabdus halotolerans]QJB70384.1 type II secretion system protein M [Parasphingorhabdus halotolerans]